jgi:hypothetical protein
MQEIMDEELRNLNGQEICKDWEEIPQEPELGVGYKE